MNRMSLLKKLMPNTLHSNQNSILLRCKSTTTISLADSQNSTRKILFRCNSSSTKTFYDSQSGGLINVGGGPKLHDVTFANTKVDEFQNKLSQVLSHQLLYSIQVMRTDSRTLDTIALTNPKDNKLPLIFLKADSIPEIIAHKDLIIKVDGYVIDMSTLSTIDERKQQIALIKKAISFNKQIRIMLRTNLSNSSHSPSCVITTGGIIGDLCDAGANIIMLEHYDDTGNNNPIDCDTVRECIEEALYLDCSGDPIKQRLGLYSQNINAIKVAIDLGCNQFVSDKDIDHDLDMYLQ
jgi:hypothetical protein